VGLRHSQAAQAAAEGANKASQEADAKLVMLKLLPDLPGKEVVIMTVTYPPEHSGAVHRHNANGFIYVLEGSVVMGVRGEEPVTLGPGQTFYETLTTFIQSAATRARQHRSSFWCSKGQRCSYFDSSGVIPVPTSNVSC
jgi:mannose-6-phosphate isomerase-like protein (cupin superfamily)